MFAVNPVRSVTVIQEYFEHLQIVPHQVYPNFCSYNLPPRLTCEVSAVATGCCLLPELASPFTAYRSRDAPTV